MQLNYLDIVVICILLFGIIDGFGKGFIVTFLNIAGLFLSIYIAKYFCSGLTEYLIKHTNVLKKLEEQFTSRTEKLGDGTLFLFKLIDKGGNGIAENLSVLFISAACFLCIFIIATLIINIIKDLLSFRVRRTSLRYLDLSLGCIMGFIRSSLIIFIFFAVITPLLGLFPKDNEFVRALNDSKLAKYFYLYNFILPWIHMIGK